MNIYRALQKHLDVMPIAFPESESGIEIDILKRFFSEEEASLYLDDAFMRDFISESPRQMRTIPINKTVLTGRNVSRYDNTRAFAGRAGSWWGSTAPRPTGWKPVWPWARR